MPDIPLYPFFGVGRLLVFNATYPSGSSQPAHNHDVPQLLHGTQGVMRLTTPDGYWVVPPGRAVWIPAHVIHEIDMVGSVAMLTLYVRADVAPAAAGSCAVVEVPALLRHIIRELSGELGGGDVPLTPRGSALEDLALIELDRLQALPFFVPLPRDPRLRKLCRLTIEQPMDGRSFEVLAELAGGSGRTLRRLFQKEVGMSYATWRQQVRLIEGLAKLAEGVAVSDVAFSLGYATPSGFSAMVKRMMGVAPSQLVAGS